MTKSHLDAAMLNIIFETIAINSNQR